MIYKGFIRLRENLAINFREVEWRLLSAWLSWLGCLNRAHSDRGPILSDSILLVFIANIWKYNLDTTPIKKSDREEPWV